jgi:hypothetical protein
VIPPVTTLAVGSTTCFPAIDATIDAMSYAQQRQLNPPTDGATQICLPGLVMALGIPAIAWIKIRLSS